MKRKMGPMVDEKYIIFRVVNGKKEELETVNSILWAASVIESNIESDKLQGVDAEYSVSRKEMSPMG